MGKWNGWVDQPLESALLISAMKLRGEPLNTCYMVYKHGMGSARLFYHENGYGVGNSTKTMIHPYKPRLEFYGDLQLAS